MSKGVLNRCLRVCPSGGQVDTLEKFKSGGTSIDVYNTCLGIYDRSGGQVNISGEVKSTSKGAYVTFIEVNNTCLGVYDQSGRRINTPGNVKSMSKRGI